MEISKKDIKCKGVVEKIERLSISIQKFIELVNRNLPEEFKLKEEKLII